MSVANELSIEVATAMLVDEKLRDAKESLRVLLAFHSTLRNLSSEERRRRRAKFLPVDQNPLSNSATPGTH
jgi:hypothetical protein